MIETPVKIHVVSKITDLNDVVAPNPDKVVKLLKDEEFVKISDYDDFEIRKLILSKLTEEATDTISMLVDGSIVQNGTSCELRYEQYSDDCTAKTLNRLAFSDSDKDTLTILRSGEVFSRMTFDCHEKYIKALYKLAFGTIELNVYTKKLVNNLNSNGGTLALSYVLEMVGGNIQYCELLLSAYEAK